jgi:hypothetical protein
VQKKLQVRLYREKWQALPVVAFMNKNGLRPLGLCGWSAKIHGYFHLFKVLNYAVRLFEPRYIFHEGLHKPLGVLRGHYQPAFHLAFGRAGHYVYKIEYKLGMAMGNYGKVGILAFSYFFGYFNIQLPLILVAHGNKNFWQISGTMAAKAAKKYSVPENGNRCGDFYQ